MPPQVQVVRVLAGEKRRSTRKLYTEAADDLFENTTTARISLFGINVVQRAQNVR